MSDMVHLSGCCDVDPRSGGSRDANNRRFQLRGLARQLDRRARRGISGREGNPGRRQGNSKAAERACNSTSAASRQSAPAIRAMSAPAGNSMNRSPARRCRCGFGATPANRSSGSPMPPDSSSPMGRSPFRSPPTPSMRGTGWSSRCETTSSNTKAARTMAPSIPVSEKFRIIAQEEDILPRTGVLRFDHLRLHNSLAEAFSQEVSLTFPAGSFRAPSDGAAKTSGILGGVKSDDVAEAAAAGFSYHRMNLAWGGVERKPGEYDFRRYDQIVQEARNRGMSTLFMLGLGHPAYTGGSTTPPRSDRELDAFANYVSASAKTFQGEASGLRDMERTQLPLFLATDAVGAGIWQVAEARDRRHPSRRPGRHDHRWGAGATTRGSTSPN